MSANVSLIKRAVAIVKDEGAGGLARRASTFGKMRLLSVFQRYERTREIYHNKFDSRDYWTQRYADGRDSGPGSRGEYARYKADFLNEFVAEHDVESVIEFGCGDGDQVELAEYPEYVGLEVSEAAVDACARRFADDETKSFLLYDPPHFHNSGALTADLVISLEVLFHLVEDEIFEKTMHDMFDAATEYVILFSSNHTESTPELHIRHRRFTEYVEKNFPEYELIETVENEYESRHSDFYVYENRS